MNDQADTTNEADDTEAHSHRAGIQIAKSANDTEGHAYRGVKPADDSNDDDDDTEGNCYKYRDGVPAGRPDDTEGHGAFSGHLQPADGDSDGRGQKNPG